MFRLIVVLIAIAGLAWAQPATAPSDDAAVAAILDDFHDAASKGDGVRYFSHFAPDAVFFGTDATERWTLSEFRDYAMQRFEAGTSWTYQPRDRHVFRSADGRTAWFDEVVVNVKYGACRGTGVLVLLDGHWRIAQYNLTIPIPNAIALDVVEMIRAID
jgi:hypothetical protein